MFVATSIDDAVARNAVIQLKSTGVDGSSSLNNAGIKQRPSAAHDCANDRSGNSDFEFTASAYDGAAGNADAATYAYELLPALLDNRGDCGPLAGIKADELDAPVANCRLSCRAGAGDLVSDILDAGNNTAAGGAIVDLNAELLNLGAEGGAACSSCSSMALPGSRTTEKFGLILSHLGAIK